MPAESEFLNRYRCPDCGHEWTDVWSCACDDSCPRCSTKSISPYQSTRIQDRTQMKATIELTPDDVRQAIINWIEDGNTWPLPTKEQIVFTDTTAGPRATITYTSE